MAGLQGDRGSARPCAGVQGPVGGSDIPLGPKDVAVRPGEWRGEQHLQRLRGKSEQASWRGAQHGKGAEARRQSCSAVGDSQLGGREAPEDFKDRWSVGGRDQARVGLCKPVLRHLRAELTSPAQQRAAVCVCVRTCVHTRVHVPTVYPHFSLFPRKHSGNFKHGARPGQSWLSRRPGPRRR